MASYYWATLLRPTRFRSASNASLCLGQLSRRDHALLVAAVEGRESTLTGNGSALSACCAGAGPRSRRKGWVSYPPDEIDLRICDTGAPGIGY